MELTGNNANTIKKRTLSFQDPNILEFNQVFSKNKTIHKRAAMMVTALTATPQQTQYNAQLRFF